MSDLGPRPPRTWRDVQAARPDPVADALEVWHAAPDRPEYDCTCPHAIDAFTKMPSEIYARHAATNQDARK